MSIVEIKIFGLVDAVAFFKVEWENLKKMVDAMHKTIKIDMNFTWLDFIIL